MGSGSTSELCDSWRLLADLVRVRLNRSGSVAPTCCCVVWFRPERCRSLGGSVSGLLRTPLTRQENIVIQACVVATTGIAFRRGASCWPSGGGVDASGRLSEGARGQGARRGS